MTDLQEDIGKTMYMRILAYFSCKPKTLLKKKSVTLIAKRSLRKYVPKCNVVPEAETGKSENMNKV